VEQYLDLMETICVGSEPPASTAQFLDKILNELSR
jgi:hypothetical protein